MKKLLLLLALLSASPAQAVYQPGAGCGIGYISVAGLCLTTTGLKILKSSTYSGGVGAFASFSDASIGSITRGSYQVTTGKVFVLYAVKYQVTQSAAAGNAPQIVYCDNDPGQDTGSTTCTNGKGMIDGAALATGNRNNSLGAGQSTLVIEKAFGGQAAALKYPALYNSNVNAVAELYGYEI